MGEERPGYAQTRARLEEIVAQVRRKDLSLEKSLDLLEEAVRLANECNELTDQTEWRAVIEERDAELAVAGGPSGETPDPGSEAPGEPEEPGDGHPAEAVSGG